MAVDARSQEHHWDVFISHASEDKDAVAEPLHRALVVLGLTVWFDKAVLQLGDSLREKIDEGLRACRFGVVILSPRFFEKNWPKAELDGLISRQISAGEKIVLPIWHDVTEEDVRQFSPILARRLAVNSSTGIDSIARQIFEVVRGAGTIPLPAKADIPTAMTLVGVSAAKTLSVHIGSGDVYAARVFLEDSRGRLYTLLGRLLGENQSQVPHDLTPFMTELEPVIGDYLCSLITLLEQDSSLLEEEVRAVFRIGEQRLGPQSGYSVWVDMPTWVLWWLDMALGAFAVWRERWKVGRLLTEQSYLSSTLEFIPSANLMPGYAGSAVAISRLKERARTRPDALLPLLDLGNGLREIGMIRQAYREFVTLDEMPFQSIAVFDFLRALRQVQVEGSTRHSGWIYMSGHVMFFATRLASDRDLFRRVAASFFEITEDELAERVNGWIETAIGGRGQFWAGNASIPVIKPKWQRRPNQR